MTNLEALKGTCNAICNTFYPDYSAMKTMLFHNSIDADATAKPKDPALLKVAIQMVNGFVENSRSEGGVSTSTIEKAVERNIAYWCAECGLDASEFVAQKTIENGSTMW